MDVEPQLIDQVVFHENRGEVSPAERQVSPGSWQARSATLAKQVWGGIRLNGVIQHQKHITAVSHASTGLYLVTFDRHVDNCAIELTSRHEGGGIAGFPQFRVDPGASTSQVRVQEVTADGTSLIDGDFDIFGMCPSS